jgi:hypothetical protein
VTRIEAEKDILSLIKTELVARQGKLVARPGIDAYFKFCVSVLKICVLVFGLIGAGLKKYKNSWTRGMRIRKRTQPLRIRK